MPRKKRTSTTEKTSAKTEPKSVASSRSKSRSAKPTKKGPGRPRKEESTSRSKSTAKRGRPSTKAKVAVATEDRSRESSASSASPEKRRTTKKTNSNVERSTSKAKKEVAEKPRSTRTASKSKSRGRPKSAKSASKTKTATKVKEEEKMQTKSGRKPRKSEKKEKSPSPEPEAITPTPVTPRRKRQTKEPKTLATPATEDAKRLRTRIKTALVCKKEESERSEKDETKSTKAEEKLKTRKKEKKSIPSRAQAKLLQKKIKKEAVDLPQFPTHESSIENLIVEAIKGLKTKAMEDRIIGYLGKRFADVNGDNVKNVLQRMEIDEKLLLKGMVGSSIKCGKRDLDRDDLDSLEGSLKRVKTSRTSSPAAQDMLRPKKALSEEERLNQKSSMMEIETVKSTGDVKNEDINKKIEEENPAGDVAIKEEPVPPILIQEDADVVVNMSASDAKKALIEYYERKLLGIRGLPTTEKKDKRVEIAHFETPIPLTHSQNLTQSQIKQPAETPQPQAQPQVQAQNQMIEEPKQEEPEEPRISSSKRQMTTEILEQIVNEKRNLSFDKEPLVDKKQQGSNKGKGSAENNEKIEEEDVGRGMVIWELQEASELEKIIDPESLKDGGEENRIELLMKLFNNLPEVAQQGNNGEQKIEEPLVRAEERVQEIIAEQRKPEENVEKIEDTTENKEGRVGEETSTKTEPKVEEPEQKAEEGVQIANKNVGEDPAIKKMKRTAVENYLELLQGRIDLNNRENIDINALSTSEEDKSAEKNKSIDKEKRIDEDYVKEESDQDRPQKLSVSKFLS